MFAKLFHNTVFPKSFKLPSWKQTTSVTMLVAGIGLFGIKSANARNVLVQTPEVSQSSSYTIAQLVEANLPLYGSWYLKHSVDGIVHQSVLEMNGHFGNMRTRYFDPTINRKESVDQQMVLKSSPYGLVLLGYNPVYAGTSTRHPNYAADNFLFSINDDGTFIAYTCDDDRRCSAVDVQKR